MLAFACDGHCLACAPALLVYIWYWSGAACAAHAAPGNATTMRTHEHGIPAGVHICCFKSRVCFAGKIDPLAVLCFSAGMHV